MSPSRGDILELGDWLVDRALADKGLKQTVVELAARLCALGIPVDRCRLTWPTLHPLFEAETLLWTVDDGVSSRRFDRQVHDQSGWLESPIKWMLDNDNRLLRARLDGGPAEPDFALYAELRADGFTDHVAMRTQLFAEESLLRLDGEDFGLYVAWSTRAPEGFGDTALDALSQVQRYVSLFCKLIVYPRLISNVANTYLGPTIAREVLGGRITLGSGSQVEALLWYSDLRNSTGLAETMGSEPYLALLNDYFDCTGRAVVEAGGEVLAFVGDAVLAIFPIAEGAAFTTRSAVESATAAALAALRAGRAANARRSALGEQLIDFGIAMCIGEVRLGNIGISQRLSFSVVGPSANEVERIEKMTKILRRPVLATEDVAMHAPPAWQGLGSVPLRGMRQAVSLFGLAGEDGPLSVERVQRVAQPIAQK